MIKITSIITKALLIASMLLSHNIEEDPKWKKYYRGTFIAESSEYGYGGYLRVKRTTRHSFKDFRVFLHFIGDESYKKIRYKDSSKFRKFNQFYNYATISIAQNTKINVNLRYHGNQGFGIFIKDSKSGHLNAEVGMAYDISDYLNDSRKTSYLKAGLYWDQDFEGFETKFEIEHYNQISDIIDNTDLSRFEMLFEIYWSIDNNWRIVLGYETEQFDYSDNTANSSKYISIAFHDILNINKLKNRLF